MCGRSLVLPLCGLLSLAALQAAGAQPQRLELAPGDEILGFVLEDLDGDGLRDALIASESSLGPDASQRSLSVYTTASTEGELTLTRARELQIPDDVIAWGLGDFAGRGTPQLVYLTATSAFLFDAESGEATRILKDQDFFFTMPSTGSLPYWDAILDLDGDGLDDLILPEPRGYAIYRQTAAHDLERAGRVLAGSDYVTPPTTERRRRWQHP